MDGLYTFLKEGLLNKSNKTNTISLEEALVDALNQDWPNMADIYYDQTMPTWVVEIKGDTAYILRKDYDDKVVPVTCHIGSHTLNVIKNTKIKEIEAPGFILRDESNAINKLSNISLHSTDKRPVFPFRFYKTWELENVTFKSDSIMSSVDYFRLDRSLIIKKNVKLGNEVINIAKIGDTETLGYDYSAVKKFKCIIGENNPLCIQIIKWLEQKKDGVAKDEDLEKLIGDIPPSAKRYEYAIRPDSIWDIHLEILDPKYNSSQWEWNGFCINAWRNRRNNSKTYNFMDDPDIPVYKKKKIN